MKTNILDYHIDCLTFEQARETVKGYMAGTGQQQVVTLNPEMMLAAQRDQQFAAAINTADLVLADGTGLLLASWLVQPPLPQRIPGVDFITAVLADAAAHNQSVYFLGGRGHVAQHAAEKMRQQFPQLQVAGADSGGVIPLGQQTPALVGQINAAQPALLLVAFGHGKQERWIADHLSQLPSVRVAMGVGGTFDFLSGQVRRAPAWLRQMGLEWLWRLVQQPWRIKRIINATCLFPLRTIQWRLHRLWKKQ